METYKLTQSELGKRFLQLPSMRIINLSGVKRTSQEQDLVVFDCAAGSGMVGNLLFEEMKDRKNLSVLYGDISAAGIDNCRERIEKEGWNAKAEIIDAQVSCCHSVLDR